MTLLTYVTVGAQNAIPWICNDRTNRFSTFHGNIKAVTTTFIKIFFHFHEFGSHGIQVINIALLFVFCYCGPIDRHLRNNFLYVYNNHVETIWPSLVAGNYSRFIFFSQNLDKSALEMWEALV